MSLGSHNCLVEGSSEEVRHSWRGAYAPFDRQLGNFRYILIPEIINKFMIVMSDPVRAKHVQVFKLKLK
jgi:hypothetical protein